MVDVRSFNVKGLTSADQYDRRISNEVMGIERHTARYACFGSSVSLIDTNVTLICSTY